MPKRLLSLDVLRGADIFFLVGLQPVLLKVLLALDIDFLNNTLLYQLDHARWEVCAALSSKQEKTMVSRQH